jgi:hypothetical protein
MSDFKFPQIVCPILQTQEELFALLEGYAKQAIADDRAERALAQPPDAKPVGWYNAKAFAYSESDLYAGQDGWEPRYAAPQPPVGKGEPSLDHSTARAALAGMQVAVNTGDAIPREIHERLMRDAKAQALRDFRDWLIGETRSAGILAQDVVDALERRARFHEQSAPGGK